jgi:predicted type IV restriction endonuclease
MLVSTMDFIDRIKQISEQISKLRDQIQTEEATKNAFIMPLLSALGYDVFNPTEVCPEYTADAIGLKGEKVDYAILVDGKPVILFECKWCGYELDHPKHGSQLYRYLSSTDAMFGILTNGIIYRFYTDLEKPNAMDSKPFFEFNMQDIQESNVAELKRFSKSVFNSSELKSTASNLMYTKEIKRIMSEQLLEPSPEFVKFFVSQVYSGKIMSGVIDKFTKITKDSINQLISDRITDTLRSVIEREVEDRSEHIVKTQSSAIDSIKAEDTIVTTEEELEGFFIIKSLLREVVEPNRIQYKDTQKYFGVCLDGKPTKTLCRLWFNSKQKYIGFLDDSGKEIKQPIDDLNNIYKFSPEILASLNRVMPVNPDNN